MLVEKIDTCTTREAATLLGISVRTAQLWVEDGRLQAWKTPGGHRRILRESVDDMLAHRQRAIVHRGVFEILVVEDEPVQRALVERLVADVGDDVAIRTASNGYEGLIAVGKRQPNLLITDLMMPGIDGFRMLEALTHGALTNPMHIIVITSLNVDEIRGHGGLPAGVALLHKPVQSVPLKALVSAYRDVWALTRDAQA
jgi:excisionase family DNA binding protein